MTQEQISKLRLLLAKLESIKQSAEECKSEVSQVLSSVVSEKSTKTQHSKVFMDTASILNMVENIEREISEIPYLADTASARIKHLLN